LGQLDRAGVRRRPGGWGALPVLGRTIVRLKAKAIGRRDDVDAWSEATTHRPVGRHGAWRRRSPGGQGGRHGGGGWGGGRHQEEPRRPGLVKVEAARIPGANDSGLAGGAMVSVGRWTADSGNPGGKGRGRRGRRRLGRMMAEEEEEDTTTTMAADQG
jgi:hypothetical protein